MSLPPTKDNNELLPVYSNSLAAEEMSRDYQFSANAASVCCIAMDRRRRGLLWVKFCRATRLDKTATFLPLLPQLRTSPSALADFRLRAKIAL